MLDGKFEYYLYTNLLLVTISSTVVVDTSELVITGKANKYVIHHTSTFATCQL